MKTEIELVVPPELINDKDYLYKLAAYRLKVDLPGISAVHTVKRSIDARGKNPVFRLLTEVYINELPPSAGESVLYKQVDKKKKILIVGCGPAGMFAALKLIETGIRPVIIERGRDVQSRRRDLKAIQQFHNVNPDSNYCFGEGGAGTFSDGKLYTRATKRGDIKKIIRVFVQHGASPDILIDAHPHIGSNKLPDVIKAMRETITACGGEINFNSRVTDFIIRENKISGVIVNENTEVTGDAVILSTGHSARDIYYILHRRGFTVEPKPFAMGVRIEHPQELINEIQYHTNQKHENLPAASYNISCDMNGRGIYSFCMCPGGIIIPASTSPGEIVVNGMSLSRRDSPYANSGLVVSVQKKDLLKYPADDPFSGLKLQQELEVQCFKAANNTQSAPAQKVTDFAAGRFSASLNETSYIPGLTSAPLHEILPEFISENLKKALLFFNKRMKGYFSEQAQIVAPESRTSSPVRIPRDKETYMHIEIKGLFPCGEGAGYAGGIVSAALDGENCAEAALKYISG